MSKNIFDKIFINKILCKFYFKLKVHRVYQGDSFSPIVYCDPNPVVKPLTSVPRNQDNMALTADYSVSARRFDN